MEGKVGKVFEIFYFSYYKSDQGAVAGENTQEASDRLMVLQDEISRLDQHEKMLDQHKAVSCENYFNSIYQIVNFSGHSRASRTYWRTCPTTSWPMPPTMTSALHFLGKLCWQFRLDKYICKHNRN